MDESIEPSGWSRMTPAAKIQWVMDYLFDREPPQFADADHMSDAHVELGQLLDMGAPMSFLHALGHATTRREVARALWESLAWLRDVGYVEPERPLPAQVLVVGAVRGYHQMLARLARE